MSWGDVMRPGVAFPVDPVQQMTVVQALTLAWGPTQNAALTKALLIREQSGESNGHLSQPETAAARPGS